jgi:hypothetical protein
MTFSHDDFSLSDPNERGDFSDPHFDRVFDIFAAPPSDEDEDELEEDLEDDDLEDDDLDDDDLDDDDLDDDDLEEDDLDDEDE